MLFQLGTKIYNGLFAPSSWSKSGNEANYAQHAIINGKPALQLTGETLEQVTLIFELRVEYCNPGQEIKDLDKWKSDGEILPLLLGNGEYVNDYVIASVEQDIVQIFDDGTIIEANITINLLEFVAYSKAEQQAAQDRKNALAVGDKQQISRRPSQKKTSEAEAHAALMDAENKAWAAAEEAQKALETGAPDDYVQGIRNKIAKAQDAMTNARQKISNVQAAISGATGIISSIVQSGYQLSQLEAIATPPISLQSLNDGIQNLQSGIGLIGTNSTVFTHSIILRKF